MENRDLYLNTTFAPAMTWQSHPPMPEQSLDFLASILKENIPNIGLINPNLLPVSADPGFIERASRFSLFGSHSFNGRTSQLESNNTEFGEFGLNSDLGNLKIARVLSSSPSEISSVSEQFLIVETEKKIISDSNPSKKKKSVSKGKSQNVVVDEQDDRDTKRCKINENKGIENDNGKKERKDEKQTEKQDEASTKAPEPEPPKDYIHVRVRRGQATDSHSIAERAIREKISERMKFLQDLVPGCNKITGKALMLDEIINYVQSLQLQVEFFSMKLAWLDPLDFHTDPLLSMDKQDSYQAKTEFSNGPISLQLPFVDDFGQGFSQFLGSDEDDLPSIVQMGFSYNRSTKPASNSQIYPESSDATNMRIEL